MVIVQHDYSLIKKPKMTDSWLLHLSDIKNIYDISEGSIGIKFYRRSSRNEYRINLEGESKEMLASELLKILMEADGAHEPKTINGDVKLK